jgi:hypothetical protein
MFAKADSTFTHDYGIAVSRLGEGNIFGKQQKEFIDTIKVKALVSYDYSYSPKYDELKIEPVFVTYLMQIRKHYYPSHPDVVFMNEQLSIEIIGYLGEHGEPLSKIINVWQTKLIKK